MEKLKSTTNYFLKNALFVVFKWIVIIADVQNNVANICH